MFPGNPVISTVTLASNGACVELSITRSKVLYYTYTCGAHHFNPWGSPLESSLRLVLGDEDVSGALVIDIVIDQTQ